jgi:dTDP-glucose pyrophosphorylase
MKNISVSPETSIKNAMKKLDETGERCLLVTNQENMLLGTLSDGDLRRAILSGNGFSSSIEGVYNISPIVINSSETDQEVIKKQFIDHKIDLIPIVDSDNTVEGFKTWESVFGNRNARESPNLDVPVVIMAGGKGTRLEPFTKVLPKPLLPINEKPVIEHIIEKFTGVGCVEFYLTVNYKARILKAYFEELSPDYSVSFIDEPEPLGTAGSLKYLQGKFKMPFFVTNCDIIIKTDYRELYNFHKSNKYDLTLVASTKEYVIPYGTCELNGDGHLSHINEKPRYDFLINTGLYVLNPEMLDMIPASKFFHITHLIELAKNTGKNIGVFPIDEDSWIDVGQWAEYHKAVDRL